MKALEMTYSQALAHVKAARPSVEPNDGFRKQLQLFRQMDFRLDPTNKAFKYYKMTFIRSQVLHTKILPAEVRSLKTAGDDDSAQTEANRIRNNGPLFRCKRCRTVLISQANVLPHVAGRALHWCDIMTTTDFSCRDGIFVEPVRWMEKAFQTLSGKLHCPKCGGKVGSYSWTDTVNCSCAAKMSPAFHLSLKRVDRCTMVKELEADI